MDNSRVASFYTHSKSQIQLLEIATKNFNHLTTRQILNLANQLVIHNHVEAKKILLLAEKLSSNKGYQERLKYLSNLNLKLSVFLSSKNSKESHHLAAELLKLEGFTFINRKSNSLLVIFTTIYNNFGISNILLYEYIKKYNISILFLHDTSENQYMCGVIGLGRELNQVSDSILKICKENQISKTFFLGYSSGGFACVYVANQVFANRCLALSFCSDLSLNTALRTDLVFPRDRRKLIDPIFLIDLKNYLHNNVSMRFIAGDQSPLDVEFLNNLKGIKATEISVLKSVGHEVPQALIIMNEVESQLDWLLSSE